MQEQNFHNHTKSEPKFISIALLWILFIIIGIFLLYAVTSATAAQWVQQYWHIWLYLWFWCIIIIIALLLLTVRSYATKLQDRIIRQEVEFRYFVMTQQTIDPRITLKQMIALRFAWDEEFISICKQVADQQLEPITIKHVIKHWKPDHVRV
jgi:H+/Cl- antiporter ClcA